MYCLLFLGVEIDDVTEFGLICIRMGGGCGEDGEVDLGLAWVDFESVYICVCLPSGHPETTAKQHGLAVCAKRLNIIRIRKRRLIARYAATYNKPIDEQ